MCDWHLAITGMACAKQIIQRSSSVFVTYHKTNDGTCTIPWRLLRSALSPPRSKRASQAPSRRRPSSFRASALPFPLVFCARSASACNTEALLLFSVSLLPHTHPKHLKCLNICRHIFRPRRYCRGRTPIRAAGTIKEMLQAEPGSSGAANRALRGAALNSRQSVKLSFFAIAFHWLVRSEAVTPTDKDPVMPLA